MNERNDGLLLGIWQRVFPRIPDFQGRIAARCRLLETALGELAEFLADGSGVHAQAVRDHVDRAHGEAQRDLDRLNRSFITGIDREDIDILINRVDHVFDYAASAVREFELLDVVADPWMTGMVASLRKGAAALTEGFERFRDRPEQAEPFAARARFAEQEIESLYREALAELFSPDAVPEDLNTAGDPQALIAFIFDRMKRREVYRHLSNAADRLAHIGEALHDLSVKYG
jgi:uncharacterized protein Yka (UPF0111/DUF47 family)